MIMNETKFGFGNEPESEIVDQLDALHQGNALVSGERKWRILVSRQDYSGCSCIRLTFPMAAINEWSQRIEMKYAEGTESISDEEIAWADAVVFQRKVIPYWSQMARYLHSIGKKVIYEVDDAIVDYHMSKGNPGKAYYDQEVNQDGFKRIVDVVDGFSTTTNSLKETFDKYSATPAVVLPNSLPLGWISKAPLKSPVHLKHHKVISWVGSAFHAQDVPIILPAFKHIAESRPDTRFMCIGYTDPEFKKQLPPMSIVDVPWVPVPKFYHIYRQIPFHFAVAPLYLPCKFNEGKSNLKILDAGIHKSVTVASPSAEYLKCNKFARVLKSNSVDEWVESLEMFVDHPDLAKKAGEKAYHAVYKHYNMDKNWLMWERFYLDILEK